MDDARVALVSATGSTAMGRAVGPRLAARFARAILELGGNNAAIVAPSADLDLVLRGIAFAAMGTAGGMQRALDEARSLGGMVTGGERRFEAACPGAFYVSPALVEMPAQAGPMLHETFAPILYLVKYRDFDEAVAMHNAVGAGLSSSIFTLDLREAERFISVQGSDCGIANVNIGPSGAEIGGAFGGEKDSGGGRESGSDAWKSYMRRRTNTINYGSTLPLAQGVKFDLGD